MIATMSRENQTPKQFAPYLFKPGQSGNPNGRPRKPTFTEVCREYLGDAYDSKSDTTRMQMLVRTLFANALEGDTKAAKLILERVDPAPQGASVRIKNAVMISGGSVIDALKRVGLPMPDAALPDVIDQAETPQSTDSLPGQVSE